MSDHPVILAAVRDACRLGGVVEEYGLEYANAFEAVRQMIGEGDSELFLKWRPKTPRARSVCKAARKIAREGSRSEVRVDDLFRAILAEEDGVPRYLLSKRFGIEIDAFRFSLECLSDGH